MNIKSLFLVRPSMTTVLLRVGDLKMSFSNSRLKVTQGIFIFKFVPCVVLSTKLNHFQPMNNEIDDQREGISNPITEPKC